MKYFLLLPLLFLAACATPEADTASPLALDYDAYGDGVADDANVVSVSTVAEQPDAYAGQTVAVAGTIREVCQMRGCWFTFDGAEHVRVEMPRAEGDYVFTVPSDISGREVVVAGTLQADEMSVDEAKHYAEDAGAGEDDLADITEPTPVLRLAATGVHVKKAD